MYSLRTRGVMRRNPTILPHLRNTMFHALKRPKLEFGYTQTRVWTKPNYSLDEERLQFEQKEIDMLQGGQELPLRLFFYFFPNTEMLM